ncbi:MAG: cation:proton antiporter, partial [Candidatus Dadabacteria bacterium]|nr:cation:proton antiporter [Candidatus Dadabacteria bacterium]
VPRNAQHEIGYYRWIRVVKTLSKQLGASVEFMGSEECMKRLESTVKESKPEIEAKYIPENYWRGFLSILKKSGADDLLVVISAREGTISHEKFLDRVPATLSRLVSDTGFIVLYPAQHSADYFIGY